MRTLVILFTASFLAVASASGQEFDPTTYEQTSLEEIYAQAPKIEDGADIFFKKRQMVVRLKALPSKCPNGWITNVFRMLGIEEPPAVNHCLTIESESGLDNEVYVQDVLVEPLAKEVKPGALFRAYVVYCFFNGHTKKAGFVLNEFESAEEDHK